MDWGESHDVIVRAGRKAVSARVLLDTIGASPAEAIGPLAGAWRLLHNALGGLPDAAAPLPRALRLLPWLREAGGQRLPDVVDAHRDATEEMLRRFQGEERIEPSREALLAESAALGRAVSALRARCLLQLAPPLRRNLWLTAQWCAALGVLAAIVLLAAGVYVFATYPGVSQGLTGFYWRATTESGAAMERIDHGINFSWGTGAPFAKYPADNFSARWEGCVVVDEGDTAVLEAGGDDAIRVVVDGRTVIDDWGGGHGFRIRKAAQPLGPGKHPIRVTYQERTGYARAYLGWSSNGGPSVPVPPGNLLPRTVVAQSGASDSGCPKMPPLKK